MGGFRAISDVSGINRQADDMALRDDNDDGLPIDAGRGGAADFAYRKIRRAILRGELAPGEKLLEKPLAEALGLSRTPVREALGRLATQGFVDLGHYQRAHVTRHSIADFHEILRLRSVMEGQAARRAATRISDAQIADLETLADRMEREFKAHGLAEYAGVFDDYNKEFHEAIARAGDSPRLLALLDTSLELPAVMLKQYHEEHSHRMRRTHWQHREIIAALKARNPEWAGLQMSAHLISNVYERQAAD
jgi:DNA-binding GntR family transcriptional regulator